MKKKHLEGQGWLDFQNASYSANYNSTTFFTKIWQHCKEQAVNDSSLDMALTDFPKITWKFQEESRSFFDSLKDIPLLAVFGYWMKGFTADSVWGKKCLQAAMLLLDKKLVPFVDHQGANFTLDGLRMIGHQEIIEKIRCVEGWTILQKEEVVQCYIHFSHSLANHTMNFVPPGFDPDRQRVYNRVIKYESFLDFVQHLPERDRLMAQLLYFGAPSLEEIISLKTTSINLMDYSIHFSQGAVIFPRHLMLDLMTFVACKLEYQELIFTNLRGGEVERPHLNQSFSRACKKMLAQVKITPGTLLKIERDSDAEKT